MKNITPTQLLDSLHWRYAVKAFDPNGKIPEEQWQAIANALVLTPSSYGLQPWKFLVVRDQPLRTKLKTFSWNQSQVTDCSHYVVFLHKKTINEEDVEEYMQQISETRGLPTASLEGFRKMILSDLATGPRSKIIQEWAIRQTYIALGNLLTTAAMLGIDACPMEGLDPLEYDKILGLENTRFATSMACALGYRSPQDGLAKAKKVRFPAAQLIEYR
jgi:nitroreductase